MSSFTKRVIVGGPPRSGTSLLRVLLDASQSLIGLAETGFFLRTLEYQKKRIEQFSKRADRVFQLGEATVAKVIRTHTDQVACFDDLMARFLKNANIEKSGWVEKTPRNCEHYRELEVLWPQFFFISMIRDGRDVVTSRIEGREGYHCPVDRYCRSMECVFSFISPRHIIVRYEDLVSDPACEMCRIMAFIGESFDQGLLERYSQPAVTRDPTLMNQPRVFSPIQRYHEERWRQPEHVQRLAEFESSPSAVHFNRLAGYS
jgi:hypothetical protein